MHKKQLPSHNVSHTSKISCLKSSTLRVVSSITSLGSVSAPSKMRLLCTEPSGVSSLWLADVLEPISVEDSWLRQAVSM